MKLGFDWQRAPARGVRRGHSMRRAALTLAVLAVLAGAACSSARELPSARVQLPGCAAAAWPLWQDFNSQFITSDARVLAANTASRDSFSEAQSYAMFFALVANDPATFERLWRWSVRNLGGGELVQKLPAWHWGQADDNSWRVLDANSASDADLWFAYALLEAGRVWQRADYTLAGQQLLKTIVSKEVVKLPGLGAMLLPGPFGFVRPDGSWRLNPSYLPIPLLRRFALETPQGPWNEIAANTATLIKAAAPKGLIADWVGYRASTAGKPGFTLDPVTGALGSYDAIRVYLWAGMTPVDDALAAPLRKALGGLLQRTPLQGVPPEKVDVRSGATTGAGPYGFSAALLPMLRRAGAVDVLAQQAERARSLQAASLRPQALANGPPSYYDHVLSLFGLGWIDNRYRFLSNGQLQLDWQESCTSENKK